MKRLRNHVVHLSAAEVYGGGEEHIRTLLKALQEQKQEDEKISLICPLKAPLAEKVSCLGIPVYPLSFRGKKDPMAPFRLGKLLKKIQANIVHSHNRREDLASLLATGSPLRITTLHDRVNMGSDGKRSRHFFDRVYLKILPRFDRVLAVSAETLSDYISLTGDDRQGNRVICNGMDLSRLSSVREDPGFRKRHHISEDIFLIGLSARVRKGNFGKKGHLRLLEILSMMKCPKHLVTLGEDAESARLLREKTRQMGISYTSLGFVEEPLCVLQKMDVVVLPSLFEGLPRSLMEAMALGKPVVASRVDGIVSLVEEDQTKGFVLDTHNFSLWAQTLDLLADNALLRKQIGKEAKKWIVERFSASKMAEEHWNIYRA
jgi:glycosyltransferase involved in cell wall biosynthesis